MKLERASDVCRLRCSYRHSASERNSLAVLNEVAKPSPAPALMVLNILILCVNVLILTPLK